MWKARLMNWCQGKDDSLQLFNFEFSDLIQAVSNKDPSQITDPLNMLMHAQKLSNPAITLKAIQTSHFT